MAKKLDDSIPDAALAERATATRVVVCSAEPADFAGIAAVALADAVVAGGDFTIANGDTSGRKSTFGGKTGVTIDANGDATHVVLDDGVTLLEATTVPTQTLTAGGTVDIGAYKLEYQDPT